MQTCLKLLSRSDSPGTEVYVNLTFDIYHHGVVNDVAQFLLIRSKFMKLPGQMMGTSFCCNVCN